MKLRLIALLIMGGMTFNVLLSAEPIVRTQIDSKNSMLYSGKLLNFKVLKPGIFRTTNQKKIRFDQITVGRTLATTRQARALSLLNDGLAVSQPEQSRKQLEKSILDSRKTAPSLRKKDANLQVFTVTPIIPRTSELVPQL